MLDNGQQSPNWRRTLWVMFFAQMCSAIGFSIIFPFLPLYVEELGTNTSLSLTFWAGMVFSSQAITMTIASPIWGTISDRYGRKMMVQRAMFGGAFIILLMAFARTAEELVIMRAIQGAITGTVSAANALVAAQAPRNRTGYAMGVLQVGLWGGIAIGPLLGGALADVFGYRLPFFVTAGLLALAGIVVTILVNEIFVPSASDTPQQQGFMSEWRHILSMNGVPQTYTVSFLTSLTRSMIIPIMPLFMVMLIAGTQTNTTGVNTLTGLAIGLGSALSTISAVTLGRLGDRIGHRNILIMCAALGFLSYLPQGFVTTAWQLIVCQGITGLALGGLIASPSALLARYTEPGEEGAVYGLDNSVVAGARSFAPLIGSLSGAVLGLRMTFEAVALVFVIIGVMAFVFLPHENPQDPSLQMSLQRGTGD